MPDELAILGDYLIDQRLVADSDKINRSQQSLKPHYRRRVQRFVGMVVYFRQFG